MVRGPGTRLEGFEHFRPFCKKKGESAQNPNRGDPGLLPATQQKLQIIFALTLTPNACFSEFGASRAGASGLGPSKPHIYVRQIAFFRPELPTAMAFSLGRGHKKHILAYFSLGSWATFERILLPLVPFAR